MEGGKAGGREEEGGEVPHTCTGNLTLTIQYHLGNNGSWLPYSLGHGCEAVRSAVHR